MKRRHFLILGGLSSFGFAGFSLLKHQPQLLKSLSSSLGSTIASANQQPLLRFVSLADTGTGKKGQYKVADAMARFYQKNPFQFALLGGDNIYNNGEIEKIQAVFEEPYQPLLQQGVKFYACLGNHDIRTDNGNAQLKYRGFNMGGRYYTFRRDAVQFFALDTNENAKWTTQLVWLDQELSRSDAPWKIVFGHHQLYSSGQYGMNRKLIPLLTPVLEKHKVQLYINGHDHHYERTQPIRGTTYLTCGGGGAPTREVAQSEWTAYAAKQLSFAAIEVYADQLVIKGIDPDDQVFDQGVISRI